VLAQKCKTTCVVRQWEGLTKTNKEGREMKKSSVVCAVGCALLLLILASAGSAIVYQVWPTDIPPGLPSQIQGKYRIIEHNRARTIWYVYDVQKWKRYVDKEFSEEGVKMYPPIHQYLFFGSTWQNDTLNEPTDTTFMNELVTIIEPGKSLQQQPIAGKQLSAKQAQVKVMKAFYPVNKQLWSFKAAEFKTGVLVCGFAQLIPNTIGVWWAKGNKIYNVNGIARSKTKDFELTFDPSIDVSEAVETCNSLR